MKSADGRETAARAPAYAPNALSCRAEHPAWPPNRHGKGSGLSEGASFRLEELAEVSASSSNALGLLAATSAPGGKGRSGDPETPELQYHRPGGVAETSEGQNCLQKVFAGIFDKWGYPCFLAGGPPPMCGKTRGPSRAFGAHGRKLNHGDTEAQRVIGLHHYRK